MCRPARTRLIGFLPDGSRAYVAAENSSEISVVDTASRAAIANIKVARRTNGTMVHPDGFGICVSKGGDSSVSVVDAATNQISVTVPVG